MSVPPSTISVASLVVLLLTVEKSGHKVKVPAVFPDNVATGFTVATLDSDSSAASCSYQCARAPPVVCDFSRLVGSGSELQVQLHLDATAAKGIIERCGHSKVRHVDVQVSGSTRLAPRRPSP